MDGTTPEKRIGDRERREVDEWLRAAQDDGVLTLVEYDERAQQCWAARTRSDLDVLTADLPDPVGSNGRVESSSAVAEAPRAAPPAGHESVGGRIVGAVVPTIMIAVLAFLGYQVLAADDGATIFGSRVVQVADISRPVEVGNLFGSTRVVVPDGVRATAGGMMLFGSVRCEQACALPPGAPTDPTDPTVEVEARGGFGSVEVVTPAENAQGGLPDDDRDDDD